MKKRSMKTMLAVGLATGLCWTGAAHALVPVLDLANLFSNVVQNVQLTAIKKSLVPKEGDQTVNYYTKNIDNSSINIDKSTSSINTWMQTNTEITTNFNWIFNKSDDENVPIPSPTNPATTVLTGVMGGMKSEDYLDQFHAAEHYQTSEKEDFEQVGLEGSRARKAANDALVQTIEIEKSGIESDQERLGKWMGDNIKVQGHGHQMQVANALASTQVTQMMKLRSMMLAAEVGRAVEAQVAADKDARAIATSKAMRAELSSPRYQMLANQPKY